MSIESHTTTYRKLTFNEAMEHVQFPFSWKDIVSYDTKLFKRFLSIDREIKDWNDIYKLFGIKASKNIIMDLHPIQEPIESTRKSRYPNKYYENIYVAFCLIIGKSEDIWLYKEKTFGYINSDGIGGHSAIDIRYGRQISYKYYETCFTIANIRKKN